MAVVSAKICRNGYPNYVLKKNLMAIPLITYSGVRSIEHNLNHIY